MTSKATDVRVLVVDDQQLIRDGIASMLDVQDGVVVVGTAKNGQDAIDQAMSLKPNIVLMDIHMPIMDGIAATEKMCLQLPDSQVVMLTTFDDESYIIRSLQAGACGYLLKDIPVHDLARAVKLAHAGVYQLAPEVAGKLVGNLKAAGKSKTLDISGIDLTKRELEVLNLIASGATNREIAEQLFVSQGTVKNHVSSILNRLGLRDRMQAALFAIEHGLVSHTNG
ncbi:MAG TPA: response regulator transcription factor [Anaerolineales bacterium]|nr:response regulator transcription factor [Anaerolineales bacterium]